MTVEGWTKVRDAGGTIGWIAGKGAGRQAHAARARRRSPTCAPTPDEAAPVVFRAEQNVLLELAESATSPATTATPGLGEGAPSRWPDGYVRIAQVFGL